MAVFVGALHPAPMHRHVAMPAHVLADFACTLFTHPDNVTSTVHMLVWCSQLRYPMQKLDCGTVGLYAQPVAGEALQLPIC